MPRRVTIICKSNDPLTDALIDHFIFINSAITVPPQSDQGLIDLSNHINNFSILGQQWLLLLQFHQAIDDAVPI